MNIHTIIQMVNVPCALLFLAVVYYFNIYYLNKHHNSAIQAEQKPKANLISIVGLIVGLSILGLSITATLFYQQYSTTHFPVGIIVTSLCLTGVLGYFALNPRVRGYALHRIKQKLIVFKDTKVRLPAIWTKHRPRVDVAGHIQLTNGSGRSAK